MPFCMDGWSSFSPSKRYLLKFRSEWMSYYNYFQKKYIIISFAVQGALLTADIVGGLGRRHKGQKCTRVHTQRPGWGRWHIKSSAFLTFHTLWHCTRLWKKQCEEQDVYSVEGGEGCGGWFGDSQFFWKSAPSTFQGSDKLFENGDVELKSDLELQVAFVTFIKWSWFNALHIHLKVNKMVGYWGQIWAFLKHEKNNSQLFYHIWICWRSIIWSWHWSIIVW